MLGIDATIYALDASTVDLCLSLFEWAPFRANRAAIKLHTLLDLRGAIPAFLYISGGKLNEVNVLDLLPTTADSNGNGHASTTTNGDGAREPEREHA